MTFLIISTIITALIKVTVEGLAKLAALWFKHHPVDHIGFLHFKHQHEAPHPRVCEEGSCPTVAP